MAGARDTSCSGDPKSTFRDRCRRSEGVYVDVQISFQAQYFGHGGGLRRALISRQVQRAVAFDMWLVFRNRRKSRAKAAFWHLDILMPSLEVLLLQIALAGLRES